MKNINTKAKVITVCGSIKFKDEMMKIAMQMELEGNVVLVPIIHKDDNKSTYTEEEIAMLSKMHKEKIKLSDAILVVNVNGYIGKATKSEIEYAKAQNKEILYSEEI